MAEHMHLQDCNTNGWALWSCVLSARPHLCQALRQGSLSHLQLLDAVCERRRFGHRCCTGDRTTGSITGRGSRGCRWVLHGAGGPRKPHLHRLSATAGVGTGDGAEKNKRKSSQPPKHQRHTIAMTRKLGQLLLVHTPEAQCLQLCVVHQVGNVVGGG